MFGSDKTINQERRFEMRDKTMGRYLPNTINSVLFTLYGFFGISLGLLLLDGFISFGSFSPPSDIGGTSVPRGVDVGIAMIFLTMGALGLVVGYQLWKSKIAGIMVGLPLLLAGIAFAGFFVSVGRFYNNFYGPGLFLGLDVIMVVLAVGGWRKLRHSSEFRDTSKINAAPARNFTRLAVAIVIAAVMIAASFLSYTSFETTVTETTTATAPTTSTLVSTSTLTSISTVTATLTTTTTSTCAEQCCEIPAGNATPDCQSQITLGLAAVPTVFVGRNESVFVSLTNDLPVPRDVNYTGLPTLPNGPDLSTAQGSDYVLPMLPQCGYPSLGGYVPVFMAIYNGSGAPVQLNDSPPNISALCVYLPSEFYFSFNASETDTKTMTIGGFYTNTDASEPWLNATYSAFTPGNYTIVAFDPWEQLTELNFTVLVQTGGPFANPANESFQFVQASVGNTGSSATVNATFRSNLPGPTPVSLVGIAYTAKTGGNPEDVTNGVICCPIVGSYSQTKSTVASNEVDAAADARFSSTLLFPSLNGTYLVKLYLTSANGTLLSPVSSVYLQMIGGTATGGQASAGTPFFDSDNGLLYVPDSGIDAISVVNGSTDRLVATISMPEIIGNLELHLYDPGNHELYVGGDNSSVVYEVDTSSNFIVAELPTAGTSLAYDPANGKIFALGSNPIYVINDSTNKVIANISGIQGPDKGIYDASSGEMLIGSAYNGTTFAIDATTDRIVGSILSSGTILFDDADNGLIYASEVNSTGGESIMALNASTFQQVGPSIPVSNSTDKFVFYDSFNKDIYLYDAPSRFNSVGGDLIAVNTQSSSVVARIPVEGVNGGLVIESPSFQYDSANGNIYATEVENPNNGTIGLLYISAGSNTIMSQTFSQNIPLNHISLDAKDGMLYAGSGSSIYDRNLSSGEVTMIEIGTCQAYGLPP
jgi:YVTN family beta-propeller protein